MINNFHDGVHEFLSNFYRVDVEYEDVMYPTVEHAYQAAKFLDKAIRFKILDCRTPGAAKRTAKALFKKQRPDWDDIKLSVMENLLMQKFTEPGLQKMLLATGDEEIIEGNTWGDTFWGVCRGVGLNHLGGMIMDIRKELNEQKS